MKIVSFGDVHMATSNLARMGAILRDTDLIIVSGDLTNFGGSDEAAKVIGAVREGCPNVLALPGNLDQREVIPMLEREGIAFIERETASHRSGPRAHSRQWQRLCSRKERQGC